jgi:hypothetical protein
MILPIASRKSAEQRFTDEGLNADYPLIVIKEEYGGTESIAVGSEKISSGRVNVTSTMFARTGFTLSAKGDLWFSTKIGGFTRIESDDNHGERSELIAYTIKP